LYQGEGEYYHPNYPLRYVYLSLEAYRLGKIPLKKLAELLGKSAQEARQMVNNLCIKGVSPAPANDF
jgi:Mn-dependent DtxR family transcriptional regulator